MKSKRIEHYRKVLEAAIEDRPTLEANASDTHQMNWDGCVSILASNYRSIGTLEFLLDGNISSFRTNLSRCAALQLALFQRFNAGEHIDISYISMLAFHRLFDALAAGNFRLAADLARIMGGRPEIEEEFDHPFDRALGYALKASVLMEAGRSALEELRRMVTGKQCLDFRGYSVVLDAISSLDEGAVNHGLALVVADHPRLTKKGVFHAVIDEDLCVWAVGLANLARSRGLAVSVENSIIPTVLLV